MQQRRCSAGTASLAVDLYAKHGRMIATGWSTRWADDRVQLLGLRKPESLANQFLVINLG